MTDRLFDYVYAGRVMVLTLVVDILFDKAVKPFIDKFLKRYNDN